MRACARRACEQSQVRAQRISLCTYYVVLFAIMPSCRRAIPTLISYITYVRTNETLYVKDISEPNLFNFSYGLWPMAAAAIADRIKKKKKRPHTTNKSTWPRRPGPDDHIMCRIKYYCTKMQCAQSKTIHTHSQQHVGSVSVVVFSFSLSLFLYVCPSIPPLYCVSSPLLFHSHPFRRAADAQAESTQHAGKQNRANSQSASQPAIHENPGPYTRTVRVCVCATVENTKHHGMLCAALNVCIKRQLQQSQVAVNSCGKYTPE